MKKRCESCAWFIEREKRNKHTVECREFKAEKGFIIAESFLRLFEEAEDCICPHFRQKPRDMTIARLRKEGLKPDKIIKKGKYNRDYASNGGNEYV